MKKISILLIIIFTALLLSACSWTTYHVKRTSELRSILQQDGVRNEVIYKEVRNKIIEKVPIGSTEQEIREFCKKHFSSDLRSGRFTAVNTTVKELRGLSYLFIIARSHSDIPVGGSKLEVIFLLDKDGRLKDVMIDLDSTYL